MLSCMLWGSLQTAGNISDAREGVRVLLLLFYHPQTNHEILGLEQGL